MTTTPTAAVEAVARAIAKRNYASATAVDIDEMWTDFIGDAEAAIAAMPPAIGEQWRPIAEAPRDGTPFMVWTPGHEWPEVIRWYFYDDDTAKEVGEPGYWHFAEQSMADRFDWEHEATHYRPLPAPPESVEP